MNLKESSVRARLVLAALLITLIPVVWALPPSPELDMWNENDGKLDGTEAGRDAWRDQFIKRVTWNCYNYAVNKKTFKNGDPVRAHPGKGNEWPNIGKTLTAQQWCDKVKARAKLDGLKNIDWAPGQDIPTPSDGENLVALGALAGPKGDGGDYHWWRLNGDGSWSHKRGSTKAKTTYTDAMGNEQPLTDPRQAGQRDGYCLCGFLGVNKDPEPDVGPLTALVPDCGPRDGATVLTKLISSGPSDVEMTLDPVQVIELPAFYPTFAPSNEVPDPQWPGVPAGEPAGFQLIFDLAADDLALPVEARVFQGVVEMVHFRPGLGWGLFYYNDDNGLEDHLTSIFNPPLGACCAADGTCGILSPCSCEEFGGVYQGDGTNCEDLALCPAPCPGDTNGDGVVNVNDLINVISLWGTDGQSIPGVNADLNNDGTVNVTDLVEIIVNWGPCPDPAGACCLSTTECVDGVTPQECDALGGLFEGAGTGCADTLCTGACGLGTGGCCVPNNTPGCEDTDCCAAVCAQDAFCCDTVWDGICASAALDLCPDTCLAAIGACCLPDGGCLDTTAQECAESGGFYQGDGIPCDPTLCVVDFAVSNCQVVPGSSDDLRTMLFDVAILPETLVGDWSVVIDFQVDGVTVDTHTLTAVKIGLAPCRTNSEDSCPEPSPPPCGQIQWTWKGLGGTSNATCEGSGGEFCRCQYPTITTLEKQDLPFGSTYSVVIDPDNVYPEPDESNNTCTVETGAVGACCFNDGGCEGLSLLQCLDAGGAYQGDGTNCVLTICQVDFVVFNCLVVPGDTPDVRTVLFDVAILPSTLVGQWNVGIQFLVDGVEADFHMLTAVKIGLGTCPTDSETGCPEPSPPPCGQIQWTWKGLGGTGNATCEGKGGLSCKCQYPVITPLEKQNLPLGSSYTVVIDYADAFPEISETNNTCTVEVAASDCCVANNTPGCNDPDCQAVVCELDSFCCETSWDQICANEALTFPLECGCGG